MRAEFNDSTSKEESTSIYITILPLNVSADFAIDHRSPGNLGLTRYPAFEAGDSERHETVFGHAPLDRSA